MIIGIDIDDTLTQFHDYKIKMALDYIIGSFVWMHR